MNTYNIFKAVSIGCTFAILCSGCATMSPYTRTSVATQSGAIIGGSVGAALGDRIDGHRGSFWGSMLGSVAGLAAGAAASSLHVFSCNLLIALIKINTARATIKKLISALINNP